MRKSVYIFEDINSLNTLVKRYSEILLVNKYGKSNLEEPTWSYINPNIVCIGSLFNICWTNTLIT